MSRLTQSILLDFETTGLDPQTHEIIEIGAIAITDLKETARYHTLVRPKSPIPKAISELTGITNEMVADAPAFEEVASEFAKFLGDTPIIAHNSSLEQGFLDACLSPLTGGVAYTVHNSIDPLALLLPDRPSHSMESLRLWSGVDFENAHRADKDCIDLLKVLVFAQDWMKRERPWMGPLVEKMLPDWWWGWYFERVGNELDPRPSVMDLLLRPSLGDLREMEKKDEALLFPEKISVSREEVATSLHDKNLTFRQSQASMAETVRIALENGERVAIEAPTGTGKSVAYLVPGVLASRKTEAPLVVSTHSKALQDQLYEKDLPLVEKLLGGEPLKATTVKGQENYLCLRKLYAEIQFVSDSSNDEDRYPAAYIVALAKVSKTAELDRISQYVRTRFSSFPALIERVRSHHTTTKGPPCPFYKSCHYFDSARIAHQSDVVVANHSLVFHWPDHLPKLRNVVFDEAHHLEDQLTEAYTAELKEIEIAESMDRLLPRSRGKKPSDGTKIDRLIRDLNLPTGSAGEKSLEEYVEGVKVRLLEMQTLVPQAIARKTGRDNGGYEDFIDLAKYARDPILPGLVNLAAKVRGLSEFLGAALEAVKTGPLKTDPAADILTLYQFKTASYADTLRTAIEDGESAKDYLRLIFWNPREALWRVRVSPIEVKSLGREFFSTLRSAMLTSATLSSGAHPTFVTDRVGVELTRPFVSLPSPYPLETQAVAFLPSDISQPGTPAHFDALVQFTEGVARTLQGRTLLLMTANHRLKAAAELLRARLEKDGIAVFDSVSDRRAIDSFRATEKALLIGSERYGEGVDIPGRQLSCVIVEKINEAMTRGPLAEARKARTRFGLFEYDFPLRMMWLKQRVGRLIRSTTDRGAVVIFDPRFHAWSAPSQNHVIAALSPIPVRGGTRDQILEQIEKMDL